MTEPTKFFILEKSGLIRIFSTFNFSPITSVSGQFSQDPSLDADWSPTDPFLLASSSGKKIKEIKKIIIIKITYFIRR